MAAFASTGWDAVAAFNTVGIYLLHFFFQSYINATIARKSKQHPQKPKATTKNQPEKEEEKITNKMRKKEIKLHQNIISALLHRRYTLLRNIHIICISNHGMVVRAQVNHCD